MDPDATLELVRAAVTQFRDAIDGPVSGGEADYAAAWQFVERFEDLDAWLNKGGFLPTDWNALHRCGSPTEASL